MTEDETACKYFATHGIRRRCDKTSLDNSLRLNAYNFKELKDYETLYIKLDFIPEFSRIVDTINAKFILVSGSSDYTTPNDLFSSETDFLTFLKNKNLIHWYCQNCAYIHNKITLLPIGLDYHTMSNQQFKWGDMSSPIEQEKLLESVKEIAKPFWERKIITYSNFHFQMWTKYADDRTDAINSIPRELVYYEPSEIKRVETWKNQINCAFVLSPHGNGLDCHRTWEALVLGCIPIVKTSPLDEMYRDLPVLIVKSWSDIDEELLNNTINTFKELKFNYDKLTLKFWVEKIKSSHN
jgi:hypothetical protein